MKLLALSDFHGSVETSRKAASKAKDVRVDVIVICGDITHFGSVEDAQKILEPLIRLEIPIFFVPGNCDPHQLAEVEISGGTCIHGRCKTHGDVSYLGIGGAPVSSFYSLFEMSETEIMNKLSLGEKQCRKSKWFVVVSHSPPINTRVDWSFSNVHAGSVSLRQFIEQKKPHIVFCGHIHEARGTDHIDESLIVNLGAVRHGDCAIAKLDDEIEVRLGSL